MQPDTHNKRIIPIIIGANGWLGTAARHLVARWPQLSKPIIFGSGKTKRQEENVTIYPLSSFGDILADFPIQNEYIILNFAYLTKDKVSTISDEDYAKAAKSINDNVASLIQSVKPLAFLFISSGAASMVEKGLATSHDLLIYGQQKMEDEAFFGAVCLHDNVKYLSPRLFNIGGPFINKLDAYVLSNFILQSLSQGQILIKANRPIYRSYCHVFDLLNLLFSEMISPQKTNITPAFEVGGNAPVEMADLAQIVANATNLSSEKILRHDFNPMLEPDYYVANNSDFESLLARHSLPQTPIAAIVTSTLDYITYHHPNQTVPIKSR